MQTPSEQNAPRNELTLGEIVRPQGGAGGFPTVVCHDPVLRPHLGKPWLKAWIGRELGLAPHRRARRDRAPALPEAELALHCALMGISGMGKSRNAALMTGHFFKWGHSMVVADPKIETLWQIAAQAQDAGIPPGQVTLLSPRAPGGIPGWNPFLAPLPAAENAEDFAALIIGSNDSWGVRLGDTFANIAHVVAAHRLSIVELMQCLRNPDYLEALLRHPPPGRLGAAYEEAADALAHEFLAGGKASRAEAAAAVSNKVRKTIRHDYLRALLSSRRNTVDLSRLWKRQGLVLVHVDRASLGEEGARFLAGMVTSSLFRTSLRGGGPVPVACSLDEISTTAKFVGETLENIATFSRSANVHLMSACQDLAPLGGPLREAMLSANVQISFRLSPSDARLVAGSLAAGTEPSVARVRAEAEPPGRRGGRAPRSTCLHTLRDHSGRPLRLDGPTWEQLRAEDMFRLPGIHGPSAGADLLGAISSLAAKQGVGRLYVRAADTGEPVEIRRYVAGLNPASYWVDGPQPLSLVVSFPTPRLTGAERRGEADAARAWTRILQSLPRQHAVLRVGGGKPVVLRVADVPDISQEQVGPYLAAALRANGQSAEEIAACANQRRDVVLRLARGEGDPADVNNAPGTPAPRAAFRTRPPRQAGRPAAGMDTNSGGTDGNQTDRNQTDGEKSNGYRSHGNIQSNSPSPFSFDGGGFAEDGSLG